MPNDQTPPVVDNAQREADARLAGWVPENEWRGAPEKWKPIDEYLQLVESQLPMARAANRRLTESNQELSRRIKSQETAIAGMQESLQALQEFHSTDTKRKVKEAREKLLGELKTARAAGDVDAELEIVDALTQADGEDSTSPTKTTPAVVSPTPEWKAWEDANPKFHEDKIWRGVCIGMAENMRLDSKWSHLQGRAFFDAVTRQTDAWFAQRTVTPSRVDKTEAGGGGGSGGGSGSTPKGKGYSQLPPDAKAQCDKDAKRQVGKNPAFKTLVDWQTYYANTYWENE